MTTKRGKFTEQYDAHSDVTIQGGLDAGARVRPGVVMLVQGAVHGPIAIESGGVLTVQGSYTAQVERNEGTLIVAGHVDIDLDAVPGRVAVAVGTLLAREEGLQLEADGSLRPANGDQEITVDVGSCCVWDSEERRFVPLPRA